MSYPSAKWVEGTLKEAEFWTWFSGYSVRGRLKAVQTAVALAKRTGRRYEVEHAKGSGLWTVVQKGGFCDAASRAMRGIRRFAWALAELAKSVEEVSKLGRAERIE